MSSNNESDDSSGANGPPQTEDESLLRRMWLKATAPFRSSSYDDGEDSTARESGA